MADDYYTSQKSKLMKGFDKAAIIMKKVVASRYGDDFAAVTLMQAREQFETLIPDLPYIGGKKNPMTRIMIGTGWCLALHRALEKQGKTAEETGELILAAVEAQLERFPKLLLRLVGRYKCSRLYISKLKKQAAASRERRHPGDWVFTVIDGDGEEFDYGIDFTECGVCKFFHSHGVDELVPFLCESDFPVSEMTGTGLVRTTTLAEGAERCNFRFKRGGKIGQ